MVSGSQKPSIQLGFSDGRGQMFILQIICLISNSEGCNEGRIALGEQLTAEIFQANGIAIHLTI